MLTFLPPSNLFFIIADVLQILVILIFVEVIRSFANMFGVKNTSTYTPWVRTLHRIVLPVLEPFRRLWDALINSFSRSSRSSSYALRRIDLSPMLALIAIQIVQGILFKLGLQSMGLR
jgi:uncharacterized protein YggT (Ycf19 family)